MGKNLMSMKKITAILQIFRLELSFAAGVCVFAGEIIALGKFPRPLAAVLGFTSAFFISGAAIVLNDYFDLEVDRINTPERPLPMGVINARDAITLVVLSTALGLTAAAWISLPAFILCLVLVVVSFLYNWKFKESGLLGNLMVSFCVASTFLLGGIAVTGVWNRVVWTFALMAFFFDLAEEIAGDAMDMQGDLQRGSRSIAIRFGKEFALRISSMLFALVVLISWLPAIFGWLSTGYLATILITDITILLCVTQLTKSRTSIEGRKTMRRLYLGMLLAVLAFLIGALMK
jgi:geranylgeranylglycerol-phosphate geranylgeranyltransferase